MLAEAVLVLSLYRCPTLLVRPGKAYDTWRIAHAGDKLPKWTRDSRFVFGIYDRTKSQLLHEAETGDNYTLWQPDRPGAFWVVWAWVRKDGNVTMSGYYRSEVICQRGTL